MKMLNLKYEYQQQPQQNEQLKIQQHQSSYNKQ